MGNISASCVRSLTFMDGRGAGRRRPDGAETGFPALRGCKEISETCFTFVIANR
jgi:hypothetical protein